MPKVPPEDTSSKEWQSPPLVASKERQHYQPSADPHAALRARAQIAARKAARVKWIMRLLEEELLDEVRASEPSTERIQALSEQVESVWATAAAQDFSPTAVRKALMLALFVGAKAHLVASGVGPRDTPEGVARRYFARSYPELADVIPDRLLQAGTDVWKRGRGAPTRELAELDLPARGQVVNDIMRSVGLGSIGVKSIETEWNKLQLELLDSIPAEPDS